MNSTSTATKEFEFEGHMITCTATVSSYTQYHPYGSTVAGEQMCDVDDVAWTLDGKKVKQEAVEALVGDVEDWIDETVEKGTYANQDSGPEEPEWDD